MRVIIYFGFFWIIMVLNILFFCLFKNICIFYIVGFKIWFRNYDYGVYYVKMVIWSGEEGVEVIGG